MELTTTEAAWLAGFVDGEGHVGLHRTYEPYWQVTIFIRNTHRPTMVYVKSLLDKLLGSNLKLITEVRTRGKDSYCLSIGSVDRVKLIAETLLGYTVTKNDQLFLLHEYAKSRIARRKQPFNEREQEIQEIFTQINKRWSDN